MVPTATRKPKHKIHFSIDGDRYESTEKVVTVRQLLTEFAGVDPATHYLIEVKGRHQESFEGRLDKEIHLHEGQTFITAASGPTPVS
jgi:hypothetical protein